MSKLLSKIEAKVDRMESRVDKLTMHARAMVIGNWNPNRRHDDPEEKKADEIRAEIRASHRFDSFADEREENFVKWHVDGHDYMYAASELLDRAQEVICILDWWLTPELYMRRPPADHPEWRLDRLLKRKAEQGVRVYIIVYKEVTQTMSMSSSYTKHALEDQHPNITVMRHPDHIGSKDDVEYWSHHEKVIVVDNHYACIGGLDLCFGRWDTHNHPLSDVHPLDFSKTLFPGQDYNNARITDFHDVWNYVGNTISVLEAPRMPWHDVHMTLAGPSVLDISQHFIERWNEVKKRKYRTDERYDWLAFPQKMEEAPEESIARHPHREQFHQWGRHFRERFHLPPQAVEELPEEYTRAPHGSCRVQVVRSVCDWSHGVLTEHSIQNAYIQLIQEANHFIYIENQFFISATYEKDAVKNQIAAALVARIIRAAQAGEKFKVFVVIPEVPGFAGDVKAESSVQTIMAAQYRTINRGGHSIYECIRSAGFEPMDYIRFYHLRAYDRLHAPLESLIARMEQKSGIRFHEAQVALARRWVGDAAPKDGQWVPTEVDIRIPEEQTGELVAKKEPEVKTEMVKIPPNEAEARRIIQTFEDAARDGELEEAHKVSDNVVQHMLGDVTSLHEEAWVGTEDEELQSYVSELLYIHSKVMIVDDRRVIMGSANFNDRSQTGTGDSEIALVVEDTDLIETTMDGKPVMANRFAATLRRQLFKEHLGLIPPQNCGHDEEVTPFMRAAPTSNPDETNTDHDKLVADPICDETLALWQDTARVNREVFTEVFRPVPTNLVRDWGAYANYIPKVKVGHVVPGIDVRTVKDRLSRVRGALVEMPLDFLIDQKDFTENTTFSTYNPTLAVYI